MLMRSTSFHQRRRRSIFHKLLALGLIAGLIGNIGITTLLTAASRANYPGGEALQKLHRDFASIAQGEHGLLAFGDLTARLSPSLYCSFCIHRRSCGPVGGISFLAGIQCTAWTIPCRPPSRVDIRQNCQRDRHLSVYLLDQGARERRSNGSRWTN